MRRNHLKKICFCFLWAVLILIAGCAQTHHFAPSPLPHVKTEYETAAFWVQRLPGAQTLILSPMQIRDVNREALKGDANLTDIFSADLWNRAYVAKVFSDLRKQFREGLFYDQANRPVPLSYFERLFPRMAEEKIFTKMQPEFALITRSTDLRELPTEDVLTRKPDDLAFDSLQYARLECGVAVAVLHYTAKRDWCLVQTSFAAGWVRSLDLAVGAKEDIMRFLEEEPLVITGEHADVYLDPGFVRFAAKLPMGARLPVLQGSGDCYRVLLPGRDDNGRLRMLTGYLKTDEDVRKGFLPYTMENVLRQAFKLYGQPYGWGGLFGGRDCSRFILDIFRTFGFNMPANSLRQANFVASQKRDITGLKPEEKSDLLRQYEGSPVLLYMRGHIMLFLGILDGRVYAIHSIWAYRDRSFFENRIHWVGGAVVSDLSLGEGGESGSLLERLRVITLMQ
jgi:hypothetical protein